MHDFKSPVDDIDGSEAYARDAHDLALSPADKASKRIDAIFL